jgi:hypothetical protein
MADAPEVVLAILESGKVENRLTYDWKYESEYHSTSSVPRVPVPASESTLEVLSTLDSTASRGLGTSPNIPPYSKHPSGIDSGINETEASGPQFINREPLYEERHGHGERRDTEEWQVGFGIVVHPEACVSWIIVSTRVERCIDWRNRL